eukprot:CAMPEP_0203684322 /NCGR_PEP_ID=MMETSP0090-20130426/47976_1 /ASSEMBLY_ACC=CAM_ASM_001088 /TAXON_ID=426623 /ORGANISM="Chaetoceros affinis, Strain CCMP159" /LENGTH=938 /DNA_ID=CAMNT_0050553493 /DNA_START=56 /DNA_END=2872 /DNA_ORIENTATION=-
MVYDLGQGIEVTVTSGNGSGSGSGSGSGGDAGLSSSGSSGNGNGNGNGNNMNNYDSDTNVNHANAPNNAGKDKKKKRRKRLISFDLGCSNPNSLNVISPSQFMRRSANRSSTNNNPHPYHNSFRTSDDDYSGDNENDVEVGAGGGVKVRSRRLFSGNSAAYNFGKTERETRSTNSSNLENSYVESTMSETPSEEEAHIRAIQMKMLANKHAGGDGDSHVRDGDDESHDPLNVSRVEFNMNNSVAMSELHPLSDLGESDHVNIALTDDAYNEHYGYDSNRNDGDGSDSPVPGDSSGIIDLAKLSGTNNQNSQGIIGARFRNNRKKREGYVAGNATGIDNINSRGNPQSYNTHTNSQYDEDGERKASLESDIFTILFVCPVFSLSFLYGFIIYVCQITILTLATINLLRDCDKGNLLKVPLYIDLEVIFAQFLAIVVSVFTARDIIHAMDILQVQYDYSILEVFPNATIGKWYASNFLRLIEGLMGLLVSFFFIVQSEDVLDLFLDFTVVQFVGELDDFGFYLAEKGYSFINIKEVARLTKKIRFRHVDYINFCGTRWVIPTSLSQSVLFIITLVSLFASWGHVQYLSRTGYYYTTVCQNFEVKFDDFELDYFRDYCNSNPESNTFCPPSWIERTEPIRYTSFNDIYEAEMDEDSIVLHNYRPIYHQRGKSGMDAFGLDSPGGTFSYCADEEAWVFTINNVTKGASDEKDSSCNWLMKSEKTDAHSLHMVDMEGWIVWTGILKVVEDFSVSCIECQSDTGTVDVGCTYHGQCVKERCACEKDWMGSQCETCVSCQVLTMVIDNTLNYYHRMDEDDNSTVRGTSPFQVYGRPVYYLGDADGNINPKLEIILYAGRRYVIWDLKEDNEVSIEDDLKDIQEFLSSLHSTWDFDTKAKLAFASEPTDNPMPFRLNWYDTANRAVDMTFDCPNEQEKQACYFLFN